MELYHTSQFRRIKTQKAMVKSLMSSGLLHEHGMTATEDFESFEYKLTRNKHVDITRVGVHISTSLQMESKVVPEALASLICRTETSSYLRS